MIHTSISREQEIFRRDTEQCNLRTIWQKLHSVLIGVCICWRKLPNKILARKVEKIWVQVFSRKKQQRMTLGCFFSVRGETRTPTPKVWATAYSSLHNQTRVYQSSSEHTIGHCDSWKMSSSLQSTGKFPCRLPTFQRGRGFPGGLVSG